MIARARRRVIANASIDIMLLIELFQPETRDAIGLPRKTAIKRFTANTD
jgi:hypothetical protein